ncbi:MAG: tRNA (N6-threonylcarbamoyladenosine(37)-N6)-methyltransferase TrmO [Syntrophomonadaceae bacterium]|jgi:tRNA-Thr(GGU) m(6)t(6)A37 methyltransferase TsaA|nr:tRNA (N6-threonylcarbamoyladenosine(37)-N6)-methyltransferase TrmO [Syntrophomonadaceae bacterium]MDH7497352.1 tRNA (N6-threonylcarbamoyladenosine(37)-N6)-methyltransferase TrmO [Syntrophomonadaceae bacterium]
MELIQVGTIRSPYRTRQEAPRQGRPGDPPCRIEIREEFAPALRCLEGARRLVVIYWMHLSDRRVLQVHPHGQTVLKGVFATRSPDRPNPLGLCVVELLAREGNTLVVSGLDALDGSPLLDIKPAD